jgi:hypothetical protein
MIFYIGSVTSLECEVDYILGKALGSNVACFYHLKGNFQFKGLTGVNFSSSVWIQAYYKLIEVSLGSTLKESTWMNLSLWNYHPIILA